MAKKISKSPPSKVPRLRFDDEEQSDAALAKPKRRVRKAEAKLDKAEKKIPTRRVRVKERVTDAKTGKPVTRLRFEKVPLQKPSGIAAGGAAPILTAEALRGVSGKLAHSGNTQQSSNEAAVDNVGAEAAQTAAGYGEAILRHGQERAAQSRHAGKLRPYRRLEKAEQRLDDANVRYLHKQSRLEHMQKAAEGEKPLSRRQQRRAVKKQYAAMKRAQHNGGTGGGGVRRTAGNVKDRISQGFHKNKRNLTILGLVVMLFAMVINGLSSCAPLVQSAFQAVAVSTYPADEADMKQAERIYAGMEQDMRDELYWYEYTHDYDEYIYDTDELWHDPHVLMAILSAWNDGEAWVVDDKLYDQLHMIFNQQYKLIEEVERTTKYRTVDGELEPYYYYTCTVTLINENLSHRPVYFMSKEQLGMYAMYRVTLGNYPDLFRGNRYASKIEEPGHYDLPEEALADPKFAQLMEEATKYIGYPYVWGGKDPSTSFDCSGFVSWAYTHSGVLNIGMLGVTSLYGMCTPISAEQARPGDMVFFEGTINRHEGLSHVGIYVGNGMMLHCGSPLGYADLNSSYFQSHLYGYGRPPI